MSRKLRRNLLILFAVIFSCLVIAGVTAASTFIAKGKEKIVSQHINRMDKTTNPRN